MLLSSALSIVAAPEVALVLTMLLIMLLGRGLVSDKLSPLLSFGALAYSCAIMFLDQDRALTCRIPIEELCFVVGVSSVRKITLMLSLLIFAIARPIRFPAREYCFLFLAFTVGSLVAVSAGNLVLLYLGLELQALALYALVAMDKGNAGTMESALKTFLLGGLSSALILYGISMLYGITGAVSYAAAAKSLSYVGHSADFPYLLAIASGVTILIGLCFKLGVFPIYTWVADAYNKSASTVVMLLSSVSKLVAFAAFYFALVDVYSGTEVWRILRLAIIICAAISIAIGSLAAMRQVNIRRLIAYSAVQHMGYIMLLGVTGVNNIVEVALFYLLVYSIAVIGFLACVSLLAGDTAYELTLEQLRKLITRHKNNRVAVYVCWFSFVSFCLSMAGVPPLSGFIAKLYILDAMLTVGETGLAIFIAAFSAISLFFYLRLIGRMCAGFGSEPIGADEPAQMQALFAEEESSGNFISRSVMIICAIINLLIISVPAAVLQIM